MTAARTHGRPYRAAYSPRWARLVPEEQQDDQDEGAGNGIADKTIAVNALTATKQCVFAIEIKTITALFITSTDRGKSHQHLLSRGQPFVATHSNNQQPATYSL